MSSFTGISSAMPNGGSLASFSRWISAAATSISPVCIFGFTASARRGWTVPSTAITNSDRSDFASPSSGSASHNHLGQPMPVAQVDEEQRAKITHPMHPAEQDDLLADVFRRQLPGSVGARECSEWDDVHNRASG